MAVGGSGGARQQHAILFGEQREEREDGKQDGSKPQRERGRQAESQQAGKQEGGDVGRKASVTE